VTVPGGGTGRWSPWARQVTGRVALLGCAYVGGGALALAAVRYHGSPSYEIATTEGRSTRILLPATTLYEKNPGAVQIILMVLAGALLASTVSLLWRALRRSARMGVTGMVAGSALAVVGILGLLTIGLAILPLAGLLVVVALPLSVTSGACGAGPAADRRG